MLCLNVNHDFSKQLKIEKRIEMSNSKSVSKKHIVCKLKGKTVNETMNPVIAFSYISSQVTYI